jgi:hypothetical protein
LCFILKIVLKNPTASAAWHCLQLLYQI